MNYGNRKNTRRNDTRIQNYNYGRSGEGGTHAFVRAAYRNGERKHKTDGYTFSDGSNMPPRKPPKRSFPWGNLFLAFLAITAVFVIIWAAAGRINNVGPFAFSNGTDTDGLLDAQTEGSANSASAGTPDDGKTPQSYTEMTLLSTGDVMYHSPQLDAAYNSSSGEYDFSDTYRFIKPIVSEADYAVVNFETTLPGADWGYSGYPVFSTPDSGFTTLIDCGFDMMLFANNHCYDTGMTGVRRTQQIFRENGVDWIGARENASGKTYRTVTVNGITLGMLNSTDDIAYGRTNPRTINGINLTDEALDCLDIFNHSLLDEFYTRVESRIKELKEAGADLIVYYIHWGNEYYLEHNDMQEQIAQRLCDLGVDVIIGGHPHVIEDADILTSSIDSAHKTLCFYSLGNLVSNQNRVTMGDTMNKEYTENGLMVKLTIRKYSTGECMVTEVETIPLWVHRYYNSTKGATSYDIIPLEDAIASPEEYGLYSSSFGVSNASEAYRMTNAQLGGICEAFAQTVLLPYEDN